MSDRAAIYDQLLEVIQRYNRNDIALLGATTFAGDLALDSLTVMDLVTDIEDSFDITLPLNRLPDLETIDQLADEVAKIVSSR
jgi:acyl carrier protein